MDQQLADARELFRTFAVQGFDVDMLPPTADVQELIVGLHNVTKALETFMQFRHNHEFVTSPVNSPRPPAEQLQCMSSFPELRPLPRSDPFLTAEVEPDFTAHAASTRARARLPDAYESSSLQAREQYLSNNQGTVRYAPINFVQSTTTSTTATGFQTGEREGSVGQPASGTYMTCPTPG